MALDHYVSQVHLRNFVPAGQKNLNAYRKSKDSFFPTRPRDICRSEDNSTNNYIIEPRAIEELLRRVEPFYDRAVDAARRMDFSYDAIFALVGFASYVMTCSPGGMRIRASALRAMIETTAIMMERNGCIDQPPIEFGGLNLQGLLETGAVRVDIDQKYPQAIGISMVLDIMHSLGNGTWEVLINENPDAPFLTSDYPVATINDSPNTPCIRTFPLHPNVALRIVAVERVKGHEPMTELGFSNLVVRRRRCSREEAIQINRDIVRCAEDVVISKRPMEVLRSFLRKNRHFRLDTVSTRFDIGEEVFTLQRELIVSHTW